VAVTYLIDQSRRIVHWRAWGTLSSDDVREETHRLMADPAFHFQFRSLCDLTRVRMVTADPAALKEAATLPLFDTGAKRAIVAPTELAFRVASLYASFAVRAGHTLEVFRDRPSALAWLGLEMTA